MDRSCWGRLPLNWGFGAEKATDLANTCSDFPGEDFETPEPMVCELCLVVAGELAGYVTGVAGRSICWTGFAGL